MLLAGNLRGKFELFQHLMLQVVQFFSKGLQNNIKTSISSSVETSDGITNNQLHSEKEQLNQIIR